MTLTLMTPLNAYEIEDFLYLVDNQYVIMQNKEWLSLGNGVVGDVIAARKMGVSGCILRSIFVRQSLHLPQFWAKNGMKSAKIYLIIN